MAPTNKNLDEEINFEQYVYHIVKSSSRRLDSMSPVHLKIKIIYLVHLDFLFYSIEQISRVEQQQSRVGQQRTLKTREHSVVLFSLQHPTNSILSYSIDQSVEQQNSVRYHYFPLASQQFYSIEKIVEQCRVPIKTGEHSVSCSPVFSGTLLFIQQSIMKLVGC